jgi:GT2 family glycosyltransferase
MIVSVVIRTRNDETYLRRTLEAVRRESDTVRIVVMNNNSDNRPLPEDCLGMIDRIVPVPDGSYRPGAVLNQAMRLTASEVVVFLNADCIPLNRGWLRNLVKPLISPEVGATFGCQVPRENCYPPLARDTLDTFGTGIHQERWRHCFSMACSAVRRDAWECIPFDSRLNYSEDIAWSYAVKQSGFDVRYAADAVVEHSHNYSLTEYYRRQRGEGQAEAVIFTWNPWRSGVLRYSVLPLLRQVARDTRFCYQRGAFFWVLGSIAYRLVGTIGRRIGFLKGRA